ncbi:chaperone modulator CbpM [Xylophilus sp. ASV27]|uniref:chaperone modulator CbpM n=1 Tax=Xylophilus sp. ASV27 TaxID=2795129 RepID=UPI0018EDBB70|nr:chaperone modulator CbpM [Xylophilus sp. ASV27]
MNADTTSVSLEELAQASGLSEAEVRDLVGYGALVPREPEATHWTFSSHSTLTVRTAGRLRSDLDLDLYAVSVCLRYIDRIEALEQQLRHLQAQLPGGR